MFVSKEEWPLCACPSNRAQACPSTQHCKRLPSLRCIQVCPEDRAKVRSLLEDPWLQRLPRPSTGDLLRLPTRVVRFLRVTDPHPIPALAYGELQCFMSGWGHRCCIFPSVNVPFKCSFWFLFPVSGWFCESLQECCEGVFVVACHFVSQGTSARTVCKFVWQPVGLETGRVATSECSVSSTYNLSSKGN